MNMSFYTAALAAGGQQQRMNVIANNIANINTDGYRAKNAVFSDLIYYNLRDTEDVRTKIRAGSGSAMMRTDTNFETSAYMPSDGLYDYAINGRGFFMLQDQETQEITYSRNGRFSLSLRGNEYFLVNDSGKLVLDENRDPIVLDEEGTLGDAQIGIYSFAVQNGMQSVGDNELIAVLKNGEPVLSQEAELKHGYLEQSNVSLADEMSKTIEASKAYSYVLKMLQTSDEIEQTINSLR